MLTAVVWCSQSKATQLFVFKIQKKNESEQHLWCWLIYPHPPVQICRKYRFRDTGIKGNRGTNKNPWWPGEAILLWSTSPEMQQSDVKQMEWMSYDNITWEQYVEQCNVSHLIRGSRSTSYWILHDIDPLAQHQCALSITLRMVIYCEWTSIIYRKHSMCVHNWKVIVIPRSVYREGTLS